MLAATLFLTGFGLGTAFGASYCLRYYAKHGHMGEDWERIATPKEER